MEELRKFTCYFCKKDFRGESAMFLYVNGKGDQTICDDCFENTSGYKRFKAKKQKV